MSTKITFRKFMFVCLAAFVGSFFGWLGASLSLGELARREFEAAAGLEREDDGTYLVQPPYSALGLVEQGIDQNGDGRLDRWVLHVLHDKPFGLVFDMEDTDFDGNADQLLVRIGPEDTKNSYNYQDENSDGIVDSIWVSLTDTRTDAHYYAYNDLNLDGRIDVITEFRDGQAIKTDLIHEYRIYPAKPHDLPSRAFWVWTDQKTWEIVKLNEQGEWIPIERDDSSPPDTEKQIDPKSQIP